MSKISSNTTVLECINCVLASTGISVINAPSRLFNCSNKNGKQIRILNDCLLDGFYTDGTAIAVALKASGKSVTIKNVDFVATYIYYDTAITQTVICHPSPTNGIPAVSRGFAGAKIFNIQDCKYYVFADGGWSEV